MRKFLCLLIVLLWALFTGGDSAAPAQTKGGKAMNLKSRAFDNGGMIPARYTCDGADVSPSLEWSPGPEGTKSYALICDDPDAPMGTWVHWVIFNLPAGITELPEDVPHEKKLPSGGLQGVNDFRKIGYGGPCPPGGTHRYFFRVYALDTTLPLGPGATRDQVLKAMKGHGLVEGQLMGKYKR